MTEMHKKTSKSHKTPSERPRKTIDDKPRKSMQKHRLEILYEDQWLSIVYKPEGLLTVPYPGSREKTALDILNDIRRKRGLVRGTRGTFAVHRLDKDTSGVLMIAHSKEAAEKIMNSWHTLVLQRLYHALVENSKSMESLPETGIIDVPLAKNSYNRSFAVEKEKNEKDVQSAKTHYTILKKGKFYSLFELELDTGRKNQIRAHLAFLGCPIAGDANYRAKTDPLHRLCLHARSLSFTHPYTGENLTFEVSEDSSWEKYLR